MRILKFGGTSAGSAERMKKVAELIASDEKTIVVLSAMSGTTNSLVEFANCLHQKKSDVATDLLLGLHEKYKQTVAELFSTEEYKQIGLELLSSHFNYLKQFTLDSFTLFEEKAVLAQGELLSTALFQLYLQEIGYTSALLPALNFMRIDKEEEPDHFYIKENLQRELKKYSAINCFVTQGFICRNVYGEIDNLKRGGSDYTASIIGVAAQADEVQIWTDIDGMHNNDPRIVDKTSPIEQLSFDEAAELAYFGAKILHPSSIRPAKEANIPVRLKSTLQPEALGTLITAKLSGEGIKAIAAKDGITAIKIKSGRMLLAYGFLRKVFEIFESYKTPIDMITTSEVAVSVTIDDTTNLDKILADLNEFGTVEVDPKQSIVCIVGDFTSPKTGIANEVFEALKQTPIRMISYGGSNHNISILINSSDTKSALQALNNHLF
jgi:aspartate kinase